MNCQRFQNELLEYVEGTLSTDELAFADKHLASCETCRQAVEKEKRLARTLSNRLQRSSESLSLRPEIRRNILASVQERAALPTMAESFTGLWKYWLRLAAIPAALVVIAAALLAVHFSGTRGHEISVPIMPRVSVTAPPIGGNPPAAVSVQMSYHLPTQQFHQEGNLVVDSLVDETVIASGTFQPGKQSTSPNLQMKTPL
jgi:anti-sigma-K factor RskA